MPALCLMLSGTYYAKNYAGIIGRGLMFSVVIYSTCNQAMSSVSSTLKFEYQYLMMLSAMHYFLVMQNGTQI